LLEHGAENYDPNGQLILQGASRPKIWKIYSRRGKKGNKANT